MNNNNSKKSFVKKNFRSSHNNREYEVLVIFKEEGDVDEFFHFSRPSHLSGLSGLFRPEPSER